MDTGPDIYKKSSATSKSGSKSGTQSLHSGSQTSKVEIEDSSVLVKRLTKIIAELKIRIGAVQVTEIEPLLTTSPIKIVHCTIDYNTSELNSNHNLSDVLRFAEGSEFRPGLKVITPGPLSIFYFHGAFEYGIISWILFRNQSLVFYNGVDRNETVIDTNSSRELIGSIWISPNFFKEKKNDPFLSKEYYKIKDELNRLELKNKRQLDNFKKETKEALNQVGQEIRENREALSQFGHEIRQTIMDLAKEVREGKMNRSKEVETFSQGEIRLI